MATQSPIYGTCSRFLVRSREFRLSFHSGLNMLTSCLRVGEGRLPSSRRQLFCRSVHSQPGALCKLVIRCNAGEVSVTNAATETSEIAASGEETNWVPVISVRALPKGERRLIRQDGETVLLLWYKNEVYAIENKSPAEGAYSEGLLNAKLTQDGCIVCPTTDTTFELKSGKIKDWYPNNLVLRILTPPLRNLMTFPVKIDSEYVYIDMQRMSSGESAEMVFGGQFQTREAVTNVDVDEVRMVVDENVTGFGFTSANEITNGRAAMVGFSVLLGFELITGKGFLKGIGFLDFLYKYLPNFPVIRY
eukprot:c18797_g1_i1 orf=227-1141(+)